MANPIAPKGLSYRFRCFHSGPRPGTLSPLRADDSTTLSRVVVHVQDRRPLQVCIRRQTSKLHSGLIKMLDCVAVNVHVLYLSRTHVRKQAHVDFFFFPGSHRVH